QLPRAFAPRSQHAAESLLRHDAELRPALAVALLLPRGDVEFLPPADGPLPRISRAHLRAGAAAEFLLRRPRCASVRGGASRLPVRVCALQLPETGALPHREYATVRPLHCALVRVRSGAQ